MEQFVLPSSEEHTLSPQIARAGSRISTKTNTLFIDLLEIRDIILFSETFYVQRAQKVSSKSTEKGSY